MRLFLSFLSGVIFFHLSRYFPLAASLLFGVSVLCLFRYRRLFVIVIIVLSFFYSFLRDHRPIGPFICEGAFVQGFVADFPVQSDFGYSTTLIVMDISECSADIRGQYIKLFSEEPLEPGSEGIFLVDLNGVFRSQNPHNFGHDLSIRASLQNAYSIHRRASITGIVQSERGKLARYFQNKFPSDIGGFLAALVTGDRRGVNDGTRRAFISAGLAHLLAISGAHFGVFSFFIFSFFKYILKRVPYGALDRIALYISPSQLAAFFSIPFMVFYLFLSGAGIPAVRSFIMVNIFLFGFLLGRKGIWKNSVAFAAFILLLVSPEAVFDVSFLLSFTAVISIGYSIEWYRIRVNDILLSVGRKEWPERIKRWATVTLIVSVSAYIGTLPLVLYYFHSISLISPVTNLIIAPVVCFVIIPVAVLCSLSYLIIGLFPFLDVLQFLSRGVLELIGIVGDLSFARLTLPAFPLIFVIFFYAGVLLVTLYRKKVAGAITVIISLVLMFGYDRLDRDSSFEVTFLDVGQAESAVLRFPDKRVMVIDTGKDGRQTAGYLDYIGVDTVDALVISHAGYDHSGGLRRLLDLKEVKHVFDNGRIVYPESFPSWYTHRALRRGDVLEGKDYQIRVFHPYDEYYDTDSTEAAPDNNDSLVLQVSVGDLGILFTGDIEHEAEADIAFLGDYLRSNVLKVAHHGSRSSTTEEFVSLAAPSVAVISAGMFNPYNHPHEETLQTLDDIAVLNTALDGAVKISIQSSDREQEESVAIQTFEEYRFKPASSLREEAENYRKLFTTW